MAHGVVTRAQLLAAHISAEAIRQRMLSGSLIRVHRGVYRVGHIAPSADALYMAAVLACGDRALLDGLAAAWLHRLVKGSLPRPEVTGPTERRVPGVITHRSRKLPPATRVRSIPVLTVPHTLIAISSRLDEDALARAVHEARVLYGTKPQHVPRPWPAQLRRVLLGDTRITLSELEREFIRLLIRAGIPLPQTNVAAAGRYVDCRWPEYNLTVELDGYAAHDSRHAWRQDRRREREAYARGDDFRRYIYEDVFVDPLNTLRELQALLRRYPLAASARSSAG
jgi:hypothetical protein